MISRLLPAKAATYSVAASRFEDMIYYAIHIFINIITGGKEAYLSMLSTTQ